MPQQLRMDPKVWNRIRIVAFSRGETATAIVERVMLDWLDSGEADKPQGRLADPQFVTPAERDIKKFQDAQLLEVSVTKDEMPWGPSSVVPTAVIPAIEKRLRGEAVIAQDALPPAAVINDPKEVGAAIAKVALAAGREFTPVPKPASTKKPSTRARR
jgi:hypothetical protein